MPVLARTYGAYGASAGPREVARTAYAGEMRETDTGWYLLGERPYNPTLRRFLAPDRASPFDRGGINRYAYCSGDPVNRIDPSGHTWLGWLGVSQGLTASGGAARSVPSGSRGLDAAATTPGAMVSTVAAVMDTVSVAAAIDSVALMTSAQPKANGVFGWVGMGAVAGSDGSALPAARKGAPTQKFIGQDDGLGQDTNVVRDLPKTVQLNQNVQLVTNGGIPEHRLRVDKSGWIHVRRQWRYGTHTTNPRSQIWATDSPVGLTDFPGLFRQMKGFGITDVTVYSGSNGKPSGRNWDARTGLHVSQAGSFYIEDLMWTRKAGASVGIRVAVEYTGELTKHDLGRRLLRSGVHVIGICFGIADEVVRDALNLSHVTVYHLPSRPRC